MSEEEDYKHFNNDPTGLVPFARAPCGELLSLENRAYGNDKVTCPECLRVVGEE